MSVYAWGTSICLLVLMFASQTSTVLPWVFPGDFRQRLRISDLVASGTIEETSPLHLQMVDGIEVLANIARVRVDRVFQGDVTDTLEFT